MPGHRAVINSPPLQSDEYDPRAMTSGPYAINIVMHFHQISRHMGIILEEDAYGFKHEWASLYGLYYISGLHICMHKHGCI